MTRTAEETKEGSYRGWSSRYSYNQAQFTRQIYEGDQPLSISSCILSDDRGRINPISDSVSAASARFAGRKA